MTVNSTPPTRAVPVSIAEAPASPRVHWVDRLLAGALGLLAIPLALVVVAFLPLRAGSVPLPVSALLCGFVLVILTRLCVRLTGSVLAGAVPAVLWFVMTAWTALHRNPLYPQVALAVGDWRLVLLMAVSGACAAGSLGLLWAGQVRGSALPRPAPVLSAGTDSGFGVGAVDTDSTPSTPGRSRSAGPVVGDRVELDHPGGETP